MGLLGYKSGEKKMRCDLGAAFTLNVCFRNTFLLLYAPLKNVDR